MLPVQTRPRVCVFDSYDENDKGALPLDMFEDLMDELGEGIHGDELDTQKSMVDPDGTNKVTRGRHLFCVM